MLLNIIKFLPLREILAQVDYRFVGETLLTKVPYIHLFHYLLPDASVKPSILSLQKFFAVYAVPWFFKGLKCASLDNLWTTINSPLNLTFVLGISMKYMNISTHFFISGGNGLIFPSFCLNLSLSGIHSNCPKRFRLIFSFSTNKVWLKDFFGFSKSFFDPRTCPFWVLIITSLDASLRMHRFLFMKSFDFWSVFDQWSMGCFQ